MQRCTIKNNPSLDLEEARESLKHKWLIIWLHLEEEMIVSHRTTCYEGDEWLSFSSRRMKKGISLHIFAASDVSAPKHHPFSSESSPDERAICLSQRVGRRLQNSVAVL